MRSLIKIRIQELFQEGLSFEMEGDLNVCVWVMAVIVVVVVVAYHYDISY